MSSIREMRNVFIKEVTFQMGPEGGGNNKDLIYKGKGGLGHVEEILWTEENKEHI